MTTMTWTSRDSYFEDFSPGQHMRHMRGKTVGEIEVVLLAHLTMNSLRLKVPVVEGRHAVLRDGGDFL